jgi:hypothetical protein
MDWIFSSRGAWERFADCLPSPTARFVDEPLAFSSHLRGTPVSVALVTDATQIDDELAKQITDFQRETGTPVGIIPYSVEHSQEFQRHFSPTLGADRDQAAFVLYSLDSGFAKDLNEVVTKAGEIPTLGAFDINSKGIDVANALKRYPITCFAGQASGRQTFIQIGCKPVACLYPDLSGTLRNASGSVSPNNSIVEHILLQSCHSPFVWPDFGGNYLSVPLAFLFGTITRTFITSTRVQSLIPGLVPLYFQLASKGCTAGEIVLALNTLARDLLIEDDPFILLGNPDCRFIAAVPSKPGSTHHIQGSRTRRFFTHARALARIIENLEFTTNTFLPDNQSPEDAATRFKRAVDNLRTTFEAKMHCLRGPFRFPLAYDANDVPSFAAGLLGHNDTGPLDSLPCLVRKFWEVKLGFYYHFSDLLEEDYFPDGCSATEARCYVCHSQLREKRLLHGGIRAPLDYSERIQEVCSRCLVTADFNPSIKESFRRSVTKIEQGFIATLKYTNRTNQPQWIFAFGVLNDPNNISARLKKSLQETVSGPVKLKQAATRAQLLKPSHIALFTFEVTGIPSQLFYLLLELNLFVNGCWNWFGVTWRSRGIRQWVNSDLYRETLPHAI